MQSPGIIIATYADSFSSARAALRDCESALNVASQQAEKLKHEGYSEEETRLPEDGSSLHDSSGLSSASPLSPSLGDFGSPAPSRDSLQPRRLLVATTTSRPNSRPRRLTSPAAPAPLGPPAGLRVGPDVRARRTSSGPAASPRLVSLVPTPRAGMSKVDSVCDEGLRFGFSVGDIVEWLKADRDVPRGSRGVVLGFTETKVRVQFDKLNLIVRLPPEEVIRSQARSALGAALDLAGEAWTCETREDLLSLLSLVDMAVPARWRGLTLVAFLQGLLPDELEDFWRQVLVLAGPHLRSGAKAEPGAEAARIANAVFALLTAGKSPAASPSMLEAAVLLADFNRRRHASASEHGAAAGAPTSQGPLPLSARPARAAVGSTTPVSQASWATLRHPAEVRSPRSSMGFCQEPSASSTGNASPRPERVRAAPPPPLPPRQPAGLASPLPSVHR